jgi:hypothetical protein
MDEVCGVHAVAAETRQSLKTLQIEEGRAALWICEMLLQTGRNWQFLYFISSYAVRLQGLERQSV